MGSIANTETGRRIVAALEQILADPTITRAQRRETEKKLAAWKAAQGK